MYAKVWALVSSLAGESIRNGISIFTACMDRNRSLYKNIKSWLKCDEVNEIVVVDWNSKKPISIDHSKVTVARVDGCQWAITKSFNLAARFCSTARICKLDCDYRIKQDFFKHHTLQQGKFYCGNWRIARNKNEKHLCGFLYAYREDFFSVNGYNEFFTTYGYDDSDIKDRLISQGLRPLDIDLDKIKHIRHRDKLRIEKYFQNMSTDESIAYNKVLSKGNPWSIKNKMSRFHVKKITERKYQCQIVQ